MIDAQYAVRTNIGGQKGVKFNINPSLPKGNHS